MVGSPLLGNPELGHQTHPLRDTLAIGRIGFAGINSAGLSFCAGPEYRREDDNPAPIGVICRHLRRGRRGIPDNKLIFARPASEVGHVYPLLRGRPVFGQKPVTGAEGTISEYRRAEQSRILPLPEEIHLL